MMMQDTHRTMWAYQRLGSHAGIERVVDLFRIVATATVFVLGLAPVRSCSIVHTPPRTAKLEDGKPHDNEEQND